MELYDDVAYENSKHLTLRYSTSFGMSSRLFPQAMQKHIYAIYGLVRIADEIVDTYKGADAATLLDDLEATTYASIQSGYSTNPVVHAFARTAALYNIDKSLIGPFFASMRMDLHPQTYVPENYQKYIHGSAEVVGLMCLKVFLDGDKERYDALRDGAAALGSAYQKVNFLRDMAADYKELGRLYFPGVSYEEFDDTAKQAIVDDIKQDFAKALPALQQLPVTSRRATMMSYVYYAELLKKLENTPADVIKTTRIRLPSRRKLTLMVRTLLREGVKR
ncbi:MAG: phytoene/squalene synthase family protein [Candidatus Nomurabacteria bacterium]|nr:MAG: phytoene/squalene synthase family protein [Candidatus Nomurabacteria bacterium]